ncbi:hypothetical protein [Actinophytocola xinjiangensis]|uniref:hypothetical protein n=1 Tax=Actinophytocola xinjiangensis TaxID=485602 RepID=UPI001FE612C2|nr:hypothetical protein [Actinophytocola xinjiangensis]
MAGLVFLARSYVEHGHRARLGAAQQLGPGDLLGVRAEVGGAGSFDIGRCSFATARTSV